MTASLTLCECHIFAHHSHSITWAREGKPGIIWTESHGRIHPKCEPNLLIGAPPKGSYINQWAHFTFLIFCALCIRMCMCVEARGQLLVIFLKWHPLFLRWGLLLAWNSATGLEWLPAQVALGILLSPPPQWWEGKHPAPGLEIFFMEILGAELRSSMFTSMKLSLQPYLFPFWQTELSIYCYR